MAAKGRTAMADDSPFIWHELVNADQDGGSAAFCALFGWAQRRVDVGAFATYTSFQRNGRVVAGMMNPIPGTPGRGSFWHSYMAVENVDECAKQASALGGSVLAPPHVVPDVGRICAVADPTGAVAHLMQPVGNDA